ncbi:MAG: Lrp/AsnC family transcriptional regulator [archaeon]|nr:Lrp/AsnC family transcriptional regulator [archaeon]
MDQIDAKLLNELAKNSSQSTKKLAEKIGVTRQTVASRITKLEKRKIIDGFRAKIDYSKLGYNIFFVLFLKLGSFDEALLSAALDDFRASHHVLMDASVTGEWDIMQILAFRNTKEYDQYIANLRTKYGKVFRDSKSHAILRIFKSPDDFVPVT